MSYRAILAVLLVWIVVSGAQAAAPRLISYQALLEDGAGNPITSPTQLRIRLYQGGGGTIFPSTGTLVYHELVTRTPSVEGIVSHMIGSGTAQSGCAEGICLLNASDFPDGATAIWIEVMVDPNGALGDGDDDVLLPRTRFGAVGYAMHADELDGMDSSEFIDTSATGQSKAGLLTVGDLECSGCIDATDIGTSAVGSAEVAANSLVAADLAANSVGASEIATGAVASVEVLDNSLTAADLAANSVGASEIATGAVASVEVLDNSLTAADLAANSVGASEIATGAVGSAEVLNNSLTAADLATGSVGTAEVATNSLTASDLATNSVGSSELQSDSVTSAKLNLTTVESPKFATLGTSTLVTTLGAYQFCALTEVYHRNIVANAFIIGCRVYKTGSTWYGSVRSNGITEVECFATCF